MATIKIIDPVTRLEGHLKIEVSVDRVKGIQQVVDARATGTLFRGFETILVNRHPWDAQHITQRICGNCLKIQETLSDGSVEYKYYAPNVGVIKEVTEDGEINLISFGEPRERRGRLILLSGPSKGGPAQLLNASGVKIRLTTGCRFSVPHRRRIPPPESSSVGRPVIKTL